MLVACFRKFLWLFLWGLSVAGCKGVCVPHSRWPSDKRLMRLEREIFQLPHPLGGSALSCVLHHPPELPGGVKPQVHTVLSCSLRLPELASFPSLPSLFPYSPLPLPSPSHTSTSAFWNHLPMKLLAHWSLFQALLLMRPNPVHFSVWAFQKYRCLIPLTMCMYYLDKKETLLK